MKTNCQIKSVTKAIGTAKNQIAKQKRNEKFKTLSIKINIFKYKKT